ncbi:hypothetical protein DWA21_28445, partial [Acinetobacter baumannii]
MSLPLLLDLKLLVPAVLAFLPFCILLLCKQTVICLWKTKKPAPYRTRDELWPRYHPYFRQTEAVVSFIDIT